MVLRHGGVGWLRGNGSICLAMDYGCATDFGRVVAQFGGAERSGVEDWRGEGPVWGLRQKMAEPWVGWACSCRVSLMCRVYSGHVEFRG